MQAETPVVEMRNITKRFGDITALENVNFFLKEREIVALLGENGAGKTTLMNILSGLYQPDKGEILFDGRPERVRSPRTALQHGVVMVHQHFELVPNFTVYENVILGSSFASRKLDLRIVRETSEGAGLGLDLDAKVKNLPVGVQQRAEILKALCRKPRTLILDEPTSNLTPQEAESLIGILKKLAESMSVVLITHKVREAISSASRVCVLRGGRKVGEANGPEISGDRIVEMMMGESRPESEKPRRGITMAGPPVLQISHLTTRRRDTKVQLTDIELTLHEGEILGIAGVAGNGQKELAEAIMIGGEVQSGSIMILGKDSSKLTTRAKIELGVRYIPEDRLEDGLLPGLRIKENLILGHHRRSPFSERFFMNESAIDASSDVTMSEYGIRAPAQDDRAGTLSGGNIQKLLVGRAFLVSPKMVIAHNPTRGLDIRTTGMVLDRLVRLRDSGAGVLLISEDLDELIQVADRIAVLFRGTVAGTVSAEQFDRYAIGTLMGGNRKDETR